MKECHHCQNTFGYEDMHCDKGGVTTFCKECWSEKIRIMKYLKSSECRHPINRALYGKTKRYKDYLVKREIKMYLKQGWELDRILKFIDI